MSWDVSVFNLAKEYKSIEEIPHDEKPLLLGRRDDVHACILEFFPNTDWSDPAWGMFESKFGRIQFNLGEEDPSTSFMLKVNASIEIVALIVELCRKNRWTAVDCSTGDLLEHSENPTEGLENWRTYRDQILNGA